MSEVALDDTKAADTPATEGKAPDVPQTEDAPRDYDAEAKAQGWVPEADYKGKRPWVDAETFVKTGEELAPLIQAGNRHLTRDLKAAEAKIKELTSTMEAFKTHSDKAEQRAYERAKKELEAQLDAAAEDGDAAAVRKVTKEIVDLEKDVAKPAKAAESSENPEMAAWIAENPWFESDRVMRAAAIEISTELGEQNVPISRQWAIITKRIEADFPGKFNNARRQDPPAVEGQGAPPRPRSKTYSDLPADAKDICDSFVKTIKGYTRERYVKEFFDQ